MEHALPAGPDYSVYGLVMQADPVVKSVMLLLVVASVVCWAIIFEKYVRLRFLRQSLKRLSEDSDGRRRPGLVRAVLQAGEQEAEIDLGDSPAERRQRVEHAMRSALRSQLQRLEYGLPFLATLGSAAPFIGLFGTVWGIVNSFTAIAQEKDTSLAVVAPGIAEALIATALGLAAAIPAVVAYNQISVALGRAFARGSTAVAGIARDSVVSDSRSDARRQRGASVEPIRMGKHP